MSTINLIIRKFSYLEVILMTIKIDQVSLRPAIDSIALSSQI